VVASENGSGSAPKDEVLIGDGVVDLGEDLRGNKTSIFGEQLKLLGCDIFDQTFASIEFVKALYFVCAVILCG
jgi:hypothetical protein